MRNLQTAPVVLSLLTTPIRVTPPRAREGRLSQSTPTTRVAVLGGGFAGLTAARTLAAHPQVEVLLVDQRDYFEYTPGILRAWVNPDVHRALVNPICRLLRSPRATFQRVPPGCGVSIDERSDEHVEPLLFTLRNASDAAAPPLIEYPCDYVVLATGGELTPISDDRLLPDGTIVARRRRLREQVAAVMDNATSALVVGGGLTGVELAAELAEKLGPGAVTLAVGPTRQERGAYPGDPGAGLLPGFRDTCNQAKNLGRGGASRYVRKWLERRGVTVLERWAVPPPPGASLANVTAGRRAACARSWRDGGDGDGGSTWHEAGSDADLLADVVFDCRGVRPNTKESYTTRTGAFSLAPESLAPSGWLRVDEKFRLARLAEEPERPPRLVPLYGGRVYCCGDAAEKDKKERTAANAHAEGEFAGLDVLRAVNGKPPLPAYVAPPRLCAISLGRWDGCVVLGQWVALRGFLAAVAKMIIQVYFVNFLPLPYWLMRRLPMRQPRRSMIATRSEADAAVVQLARSGGRGLTRQSDSFGIEGIERVAADGDSVQAGSALRPVDKGDRSPVDAEPAAALVAALIAAFAAGLLTAGRLARAGMVPL